MPCPARPENPCRASGCHAMPCQAGPGRALKPMPCLTSPILAWPRPTKPKQTAPCRGVRAPPWGARPCRARLGLPCQKSAGQPDRGGLFSPRPHFGAISTTVGFLAERSSTGRAGFSRGSGVGLRLVESRCCGGGVSLIRPCPVWVRTACRSDSIPSWVAVHASMSAVMIVGLASPNIRLNRRIAVATSWQPWHRAMI